MNIRSLLFISTLLALSGCAASTTSENTCNSLSDCESGQVCLDGMCQTRSIDPNAADADNDGIPDIWEGRAEGTDTDGDGIPDYLEADSDDDGIPDSLEGVGATADVPPPDTDGDGLYDFQDLDSDGNGISDEIEGAGDIDNDRILDAHDQDNDGDFANDVDEIGEDPSMPIDTDGDGLPDFEDTDSDGDNILDLQEGQITDTDSDMTFDRYDLDSDGDGISDAIEAGDDDLMTPPVDSDGDGTWDFQDADSDDDGLSDRRESEIGTDPTSSDSDMDGVPDLIEIAACPDETCADDATNPDSSPRTRGDFVFIEPYEEMQTPERDTLDFATDLRVADVYFLMDTTGSMRSAINSLKADVAAFMPRVRDVIPNVFVGVGDYRDRGDAWRYQNRQSVTADIAAAQAAANAMSASGGGDFPEGLTYALNTMITGASGCGAGTFGVPCFRESAIPIIVGITDATTHDGPGSGAYNTMVTNMQARNARFIGIGQGTGGRAHLQAISSSVNGGDTYYTTWSGGGIGDAVLNQIQALAAATVLDISIEFQDDPSDEVDTWAAFVDSLVPNEAGDPMRGCDPRMATDSDGDGALDTFPGVPTGTRVCFDIVTKENTVVMPTREPQVFRATLQVIGDGFTELESREILFLVPPTVGEGGVD